MDRDSVERPVALPPEIDAVRAVLRELDAPWAVAGGWAIDLALGRVTRAHGDVDVAVFREDQQALRAALPGWDFAAVVGGRMTPWERGARLEPPVHEVHARSPTGAPPFGLELLLNERDGADWVYRRDPAVRLPLARAIRPGPGGVRVLAPEVVLLYKSKVPRPADEADFLTALPLLDREARTWLRAALLRARPDHPWAAALAPRA
ncbi:nucleotidyltransferase domain-containing protein [Longimicrobium sp.]|uniref:nucleotidyltransferase domain-containing protein n=1 Tax=Longimicrobium sp. TaxID=2029185 RepID=UPI003B3A77CD